MIWGVYFLHVRIYCCKYPTQHCFSFTYFDALYLYCIHFHLYFLNFPKTSLTHGLFRTVFFNFQVFQDFPLLFLVLASNLISLWLENILCMILTLLNLLRFDCDSGYDLPWRTFCGHLKKMWILLLLGDYSIILMIPCWLMVLFSSVSLIIFWSSFSVNCCKCSFVVTNYTCGFVYFFFQV